MNKALKSDAFYKDARVVSCQQVLVKNGSSMAIGFKSNRASPIRDEFACYGIANIVGGGQIHNKSDIRERKLSLAQ